MNNVSIIGRITKDIELRTTASGIPVISTSVAINNGKDKKADFLKVYIYDKQAENVSKYCHKGSLIGVTGSIKTRQWDKEDGSKGHETFISASRVQFLETKQSKTPDIPEPDYVPTNNDSKTTKVEEDDPFSDFGDTVEIRDEDLPF